MLTYYFKYTLVDFRNWLILLLTFFCTESSFGEQIDSQKETGTPVLKGLPQVVHYSRHEFNADPQFWSVCEDNEGVLYFGNNDGAIIFDGERWHKVVLPNNSSIRCLATDSTGNVYAGGFNEFGLIKKDSTGQFYYKSLLDPLKFHDDEMENLWQVHVIKNTIIYRSFSKLIAINGSKITKLPASSNFIKSFEVNSQYFVQDQKRGILRLDIDNMKFIPYFSDAQIQGKDIIAFLGTQQKNIVLGVAASGEIFRLDLINKSATLYKQLFRPSEVNKVECAVEVNDSVYYLGTLSSGIITLNENASVLKDEPTFEDLQDKSVLNLFETRQGNIWALLNNGLDCITFNSPVTTLFEGASLYDVLITGNEAYLATNQGMFYTRNIKEIKPQFQKIKGLEGQGWTLQKIENDILVGHDKGLFVVDKTKSKQIGNISGIWKVVPVAKQKGIYLAASYHGIYVISKKEGLWRVDHKIEGFDESSRDILESEIPGTFWVCHGYKGVFRIKINEDYTKVVSFEHFTTQNGFTFPYSINVFEWGKEIVFTSNQGIYTYEKHKNQFVPYLPLNKILDSTKNTRKLFQHQDKTWFVQDDEVGYFYTDNPVLEKGYFLQFKGAFNRGMEYIQPLTNDHVLLGTKTGLYLFDLTYKNKNEKVRTFITGARYLTDQKENWLPLHAENPVKLPNSTYSLRIDFATPKMQNDADIQYAYKLDNVDKDWSAWQFASYKEYSHLRPGKYDFQVKSRSLVGTEGDIASISFEIVPLWYQTQWMMFIFILAAIFLIAVTIKLVRKKIEHENRKAQAEVQKSKKLLELQLAQMKLKAEKDQINEDKLSLQEDVIIKSKELANYTMLLVKKKDIFAEIREDIIELRGLVRNDNSKKKLQKMFGKLNRHLIGEEYLHVFETNFEQVHKDFFKNLKEHYPCLTLRELRLCAFIKMNLTNKEISPLLNISVRGVETARYRIRKKLNLEHESNFSEFLESIAQEKNSDKESHLLL
ncbi:triple tyrosine motif-containing protein [Marivirga aurantiaca]|nr:triple tyrosine motif-containing protein [Marivirga aurantiaca]